MDKVQLAYWYENSLKLDLSTNSELRDLVEMNIEELNEDQMLDLIMWIDSCFENYSITNGFQDNPIEFFQSHDRLEGKSPYQFLQDNPLSGIKILASLYNLNQMIFND